MKADAPKTTVDWLRFRAKAEPRDIAARLALLYGTAAEFVHLGDVSRGMLGFERSAPILLANMALGRMDFGGSAMRDWVRVDIPAKGCEWVQQWDALNEVESLPCAEIRRLDLALTTWDGELTHEQVVSAHQAGRFCSGGRPPKLRTIVSSEPRDGRTCYVGEREKADKFLRGYERGWVLAAAYPPSLEVDTIDGKRCADIYRVEVELKAENRPVPWECVERRDQYFAGSYPFCADILPGIEADILMRRPERAPQTDLIAALENCRVQYGQTLYTALHAYGGDMTAVWDRIIGTSHCEALLKAGVLLTTH